MDKDLSIKISVDSKNASQNVENLNNSFDSLKQKVDFGAKLSILTAGFAAVSDKIVGVISHSFELADNFKMLEARVNLVSTSNEELSTSMQKLFNISQDTASSFESVSGLYTSLKTATSQLSVSQKDLLEVTQTINQTLTISGAGAGASSAALIQLSQAFASGTLRGDELNSILEQTPRLARAIAEGMGVSVGALRELGSQGKLTSEEVFSALQNQKNKIEEEFSKMPLTISGAKTQIQNSIFALIGGLDGVSGASSNVANALSLISGWIDKNKAVIVEFGGDVFKSFELIGSSIILVINGVREGVLNMANMVGDTINESVNFWIDLLNQAITKFNEVLSTDLPTIDKIEIFDMNAIKNEYEEVKRQNDEIFANIKNQVDDIAKTSYKENVSLAPSDVKNTPVLIKKEDKKEKKARKKQDPQEIYKKQLDKAIEYYSAIGDLENKRIKEKEKQALKLKELGLNNLQINKYLADEEAKEKQKKDLEYLAFKERYYELLGDKANAAIMKNRQEEINLKNSGYSDTEIASGLYGENKQNENYESLSSSMGYDTGIAGDINAKLTAIDEFSALEEERINAKYMLLEENEENHNKKMDEIIKMHMQARLSYVSAGLDGMGALAKTFYDLSGGENVAALRAYQAMMITKAVINTYTAATNAMATAGNPYVGAAMAAVAIAQGMAQVSAIKSQKFHSGGEVGNLRSDEVNATLQTGEYVLNRKQVDSLKDDKHGAEGGVIIVNTIDPDMFNQWASSRSGRKVIKNVIQG